MYLGPTVIMLTLTTIIYIFVDCMQGKVFTEVFTQYGRRVSKVRVRVSVNIRVRFRLLLISSICVGDPTCSHSLAV